MESDSIGIEPDHVRTAFDHSTLEIDVESAVPEAAQRVRDQVASSWATSEDAEFVGRLLDALDLLVRHRAESATAA